MKVNREKFLNALNRVKPGLSPREFIEQSSCFVFQSGQVMTFNDEIACRMALTEETVGGNINITGAVQAAKLLEILEKLTDDELDVRENEQGQLEFKAKRKGFRISKDAEVFLPIDKVEEPVKWKTLGKEFTEAAAMVQCCVSEDESRFMLTCVHIHPDYIEACDNIQMMRVTGKTGVKRSVLVRGRCLATITGLGMDKLSVTKSWVHFKNHEGLILSCRAYLEEYHDLTKHMEVKGTEITIPKGVGEVAERAAVFAKDRDGEPEVLVRIREGKIRVVGAGVIGDYWEVKKVKYDGPNLAFVIDPVLLRYIADNYKEAIISDSKFKAQGGQWSYMTVLGKVDEKDAE